MLETIILTATLVVLGYGFYLSTRLFWANRSEKGFSRYAYFIVSAFIIGTYFLFAVVLFYFIASFFSSYQFPNILNLVLGIFLFSGAALVPAIIKYNINVMSRYTEEKAKETEHQEKTKPGTKKLLEEISRLKKELDTAKKLNKFAVGREMKMIELKNEIKRLSGKRKG